MNYNDVLRRLRFALDINDKKMLGIFKLAGFELSLPTLAGILKKEEDEGYIECPIPTMRAFLDGLIESRRGRREGSAPPKDTSKPIGNNDILKALRVALELRETDIAGILKLAGVVVTPSEVNALFRKEGQPKFVACGDQFLRNFLAGLVDYRMNSRSIPEKS